jgi:hypothetical protein
LTVTLVAPSLIPATVMVPSRVALVSWLSRLTLKVFVNWLLIPFRDFPLNRRNT